MSTRLFFTSISRIAAMLPFKNNFVRSQFCTLPTELKETASKVQECNKKWFDRAELMGVKDKAMSFEAFKIAHVETLEEYESPWVLKVCGGDREKVARAYDFFCKSQYSTYLYKLQGGNPARAW
jgi:hypothetical protein